MKNTRKRGKNIVSLMMIIIAITALVVVYKKYNYHDFIKCVRQNGLTNFTRDSSVSTGKASSYKIENIEYNDAMFYQTVNVTPNTPYKITCKIKTDSVMNENGTQNGGAHISLGGTTLMSVPITGTNDWQDVTLLFNSQDDTTVNIGFRLGGYETNSKGTAWFSDFKVEAGVASNESTWKFACFIFPKIDVDVMVNGKQEHVNLTMTDTDIQDIRTNMGRFQSSIQSMSQGKMKIEYDCMIINEPITTLSYDEQFGYYVSATDVYQVTHEYVEQNEYDHIYVAIRMADKQKGNDTLISDWIGLGGMDYFGIGYSNIRLPDDEQNYAYKFNPRYNTFPEEVFIHEFLHTLERNAKEYGYEIPALHDNEKYGYSGENLTGLKNWYEDYMNNNIDSNGTKIGLPAEIFGYQPVHESNFKYRYELDVLKEPANIIEMIQGMWRQIQKVFTYTSDQNLEIAK